jgi:hypothetical protein
MLMLTNPFLARRFAEKRIKDALRGAEDARSVKMVQESKRKRPFLPSIIQFIRDWWEGNVLPYMKQQKRHHNLAR